MVNRKLYLDKLVDYRDKRLIKVVTGIRRCGKSTLLALFQKHLLDSGVQPDQIHAVNFEDLDYAHLQNHMALYGYLKERLVPDRMNYIFLDEIQHVDEFARVVDSLALRDNTDLYITGSNARFLSGEIATMLSGRYVEIRMLPLSFKEYLDFVGDRTDLGRKYADYLQFGSFPYTVELGRNAVQIRGYLEGTYNTVILKDIMARRGFSDIMTLESVLRFLFDNIGNLCSTKRISDTLTTYGRKTSPHTVENYLASFKESFIIYQAGRYDVKGKQYLKTLEKYYVVDIGLRNYLLGNKGTDVGHLLENVVYLELIRRGYEVYVGKVGECEIDFVAVGADGLEYFQTSATVRDPMTLERELLPLQSVTDHYPKHLLTLDEDPPAEFNGIRRRNVLDFLLE